MLEFFDFKFSAQLVKGIQRVPQIGKEIELKRGIFILSDC